ncbi:hypothetical protein BU17DRAFT_80763 [Hysterangium stoloniferum]|nr:hypothetical protein BU17DRAFT_80763 [Hysterangium stoloniferum]
MDLPADIWAKIITTYLPGKEDLYNVTLLNKYIRSTTLFLLFRHLKFQCSTIAADSSGHLTEAYSPRESVNALHRTQQRAQSLLQRPDLLIHIRHLHLWNWSQPPIIKDAKDDHPIHKIHNIISSKKVINAWTTAYQTLRLFVAATPGIISITFLECNDAASHIHAPFFSFRPLRCLHGTGGPCSVIEVRRPNHRSHFNFTLPLKLIPDLSRDVSHTLRDEYLEGMVYKDRLQIGGITADYTFFVLLSPLSLSLLRPLGQLSILNNRPLKYNSEIAQKLYQVLVACPSLHTLELFAGCTGLHLPPSALSKLRSLTAGPDTMLEILRDRGVNDLRVRDDSNTTSDFSEFSLLCGTTAAAAVNRLDVSQYDLVPQSTLAYIGMTFDNLTYLVLNTLPNVRRVLEGDVTFRRSLQQPMILTATISSLLQFPKLKVFRMFQDWRNDGSERLSLDFQALLSIKLQTRGHPSLEDIQINNNNVFTWQFKEGWVLRPTGDGDDSTISTPLVGRQSNRLQLFRRRASELFAGQATS